MIKIPASVLIDVKSDFLLCDSDLIIIDDSSLTNFKTTG
jgi:hypothetical protein